MAKHTGGCHCGRLRFEVETELAKVMACNCSICSKHGLLLSFVGDGDFTLTAGQDAMAEYRFNKKVVQHLFCPDCGVQPMVRGAHPDGTKVVGINVRCLDDVDLATIEPVPYDGKAA